MDFGFPLFAFCEFIELLERWNLFFRLLFNHYFTPLSAQLMLRDNIPLWFLFESWRKFLRGYQSGLWRALFLE